MNNKELATRILNLFPKARTFGQEFDGNEAYYRVYPPTVYINARKVESVSQGIMSIIADYYQTEVKVKAGKINGKPNAATCMIFAPVGSDTFITVSFVNAAIANPYNVTDGGLSLLSVQIDYV